MKKILLSSFLIFLSFTSFAQEKKYSIAAEGNSIKEVLLKLEDKTNYTFFFVDSWMASNPVSVDFKEKSLSTILNEIFKDTYLNYYVYNDQIILTRNNLIYDKLPEGFFGKYDATPIL
jgi:type II secretory pathway component GspD/PulD (secretin)